MNKCIETASKKLTILVLVHENQFFLERMLEYINFYQLNVVILDSSKKKYVGTDDFPHRISYVHFPNSNYWNKVFQGTTLVNTEYVALLGVDDFFSITGLNKACDFLNCHADYVSAAGDVIAVNITEYPEVHYKSQCVSSHGINYDKSNAGERLLQLKRYHFPIYYNVMRTHVARNAWDFMSNCVQNFEQLTKNEYLHFVEVLTYLSVLIQGKHANLKTFFWLRDEYIRSASGDIEHFDYHTVGQCDDDFYQSIYAIAAKIFNQSYELTASYLDNALRSISTHQSAKSSVVNKKLFQREDGDDLRMFIDLDRIIQKHRENILCNLENIDGSLPSYYDKFAPNWELEMRIVLKAKFRDMQLPIVIYGAGEHTKALFEIFDFTDNVVAICDSNQLLWGKSFNGFIIIPPYKIREFSNTVLISSQASSKEISKYLRLGYGEELSLIELY